MTTTRIAIIGAAGRMGRALLRLTAEDARLELAGAVTVAGDPLIGTPAAVLAGGAAGSARAATAGGSTFSVVLSHELPAACDVAIDFTSPESCVAWAGQCADRGIAFVSGSTGLEPAQLDALRKVATRIPLLWSANMSIGVNLLIRLVESAAGRLSTAWDCEIVEAHHRQKADAPSGTAKALLDAVIAGRAAASSSDSRLMGDAPVVHGRSGRPGARPAGEIGMHAVRMGGVVGDHDVHFGIPGEVITLRHHAESRDIFARGALEAAAWLRGKPPGMYSMRNVLG